MKFPKIKFREMTVAENIDIIKWAYFEDNGLLCVYDYIVEYFPQLANLDKSLSKEEICTIIVEVVTSDYDKYSDRIEQETKRYCKLWEKYNETYFRLLTDYLKVSWPSYIEEIDVSVGLIPVFPRNLDDFSFSIGTGVEDWKLLEVCAHETLHFLWFEKWKQLYPKTPRREYDAPYIVWQYNEMVTDPILNSRPFSEFFSFAEQGYDIFYQMHDGNCLAMNRLRTIFSEDISIEKKIEKGFSYTKQILNKDSDNNEI